MKKIGVKLKDNDNIEYVFACYDAVEVGDYVVCDTRYGFKIGKVAALDAEWTKGNSLKEIVCRVDCEAFKRRKAQREKKADLKRQMDERIKSLSDMAQYEMFAKQDPELAMLLADYKEISNV